MGKTLRILILEDNPTDADLVEFELQEAGFVYTAQRVMTEKDFIFALREFTPDLILSDYDLPQYNGALALAEAKTRCPDIPFILVTGAVREDRAIEILTSGAKDYVMKHNLHRLGPAVQRALSDVEEHRARKVAEEELRKSHRALEKLVEERSAALQESGELYRSLFENMLNGFAYCRMLFDQERPQDFIYLDVNSAFESLTGLKDVVGKKVSEVIPGIQGADKELLEIYGRVALTGKPEKFEKYVEALKMWFSISVFCPKKEHFVAVFDVITERKLLEEARYQSERHYRLLHETMLQGVVYQDIEGKIISMNPAAVRILGKGPEECPGHASESAGHPTLRDDGSHLPALDHPSLAALRTGRELRDVVMGVYNPREKGYRWLNVRAMPMFRPGENKPFQVYIMFDDITEHRKAERRQSLSAEVMGIINESPTLSDTINRILIAVKRETECDAVGIRLRNGNDFPYFVHNGFSDDFLLAENMLTVRDQDGGICRDENGHISLECTCGLVISGRTDPSSPLFTPEGSFWTNDSFPLLDLPADQDPRLHPRNRCIHEGFGSVALIPIRADREIVGLLQLNDRKKGTFAADMITFFEGLGSSIGIALTRQRAVEAVKERTSQLEAANRDLESFTHSVAHDLRAPLRAIDGFSRKLLANCQEQLNEEGKRLLGVIRTNTQNMGQLIDDLLAFSRLGKQNIALSEIDMQCLARKVSGDIAATVADRKITFDIKTPPPARADKALIRQVMVNLLTNGVKFSQPRTEAVIEFDGWTEGDELVYHVKDNGVGFDMAYADKLFGVFQRLHGADEFEGTGVGLAIVQRAILMHGGRVWAEGKTNEGATFYFTLPRRCGEYADVDRQDCKPDVPSRKGW